MSNALSFDEKVAGLRALGVPLEKAEAAARDVADPLTVPPLVDAGRIIDPAEVTLQEKAIEAMGDKIMLALRFEVVRLSQPRATKQMPGIPDRRYYSRARKLAFWWEVKAPDGRQRPDQRAFQEMVESVGELYALGGLGDLKQFLTQHRIAVFDASGNPIPFPEEGSA